MFRFPVRRTRQFALVSGAICALVLTPAAWITYRLFRFQTEALSFPTLLAILLVASVLITALITLLFVYTLRQLLTFLQQLIFAGREPLDSTGERSLLSTFERLGRRIAADQQSLRRRNSDLEVLATIVQALNRASRLDEMLETVLQQATALCSSDRAYIALADEESDEIDIVASRGYSDADLQELAKCLATDGAVPGLVCLPLRATSGVIGSLCLEFVHADQDALRSQSLLADVLATTIEKHRLLESAQREVRAQKLLNEAGRVLSSTLDEQEVLTRVMREVIQVLNAEAGSVLLIDEERGDMFFAAAATPGANILLGTRMPMGQGIVGWAVEHRESVLTADASKDPRFYERIDQQTGLTTKSVLCVPLLSKDRVIGAIEVLNSKNGRFSTHDLQLLESLSPQAAIAIENASLFESVKTQMAELEEAQDRLLQAEKLSAIGQLVAGVAHELNNPLTAIVGYSQLLLETCEDAEVCEDLDRINREAQRSARIVQNLLTFSRQQKPRKQSIDLGAVLQKTIDILDYQLQVDNIVMVHDISPEIITVLGDTYQLQQVFLNLITNAHQAMRGARGHGTLTIRTELTDRDTVRVFFSDDGPGIPPEIARRIFDPFFTTKDVGEGTGLGLSICLGIVQEHGGQIWLEDTGTAGATFVVELPLQHVEYDEEQLDLAKAQVAIPDALSVLVVDDEVDIALLLERVLLEEGHNVVAVNSGEEAIDALAEQSFDLMICDLKMPGISGRTLYSFVQQAYPDLAQRVIFSTGDTVSNESRVFLREVQDRYLTKPFKPRELLHKIGELFVSQ